MDQSPYLVAALRALQQPAPQAESPGMSPGQLAQIAQQAKAYGAQNPGGNFLGHNLMQAGRNIANLPGQVASGFGALANSLGFGGPQSAPY